MKEEGLDSAYDVNRFSDKEFYKFRKSKPFKVASEKYGAMNLINKHWTRQNKDMFKNVNISFLLFIYLNQAERKRVG
jgi:hypothetical protein